VAWLSLAFEKKKALTLALVLRPHRVFLYRAVNDKNGLDSNSFLLGIFFFNPSYNLILSNFQPSAKMVNDGEISESCQPIPMIISAFTAIACYNCIEVNVILWRYFKRHKGLYFYSVLVSSIGIILHALGTILDYFVAFSSRYIPLSISSLGWYAMVTGQSIVLYSRLNLVMYDDRKIKWVLYMIIIDALFCTFLQQSLHLG